MTAPPPPDPPRPPQDPPDPPDPPQEPASPPPVPSPAAAAVERWVADRLPCEVVHLDAAACGRPGRAVLEAQVAHLHREAAVGGYVAEAQAEDVLAAGRGALGALLGLAGADVAFSDGAGNAFATLLAAWPLGRGARVGAARSEYGANARALQRLAAERGWRLVPLPVDDLGRIVDVPAGLDLVTFPQVASQRGVAQPVAQVLAQGTPLVLDVAQSLGQTAVPAGCAAYVGTSRKWLGGPRGVGFLAVDPAWAPRLTAPPTLSSYGGMRRMDTQEAHVAGRVGLAHAVQQWTPELLPVIRERAAYARAALAGAGLAVVEPVDEPTGISTLPMADPAGAREALRAAGFLTSAVPTSRAAELTGPVLRLSTHAWVTPAQLDAVAAALASHR